MDPSNAASSLPQFTPLLIGGGLVTAAATLVCGAFAMASLRIETRQRCQVWQTVGVSLGLPQARTAKPHAPALSGVYRGRALDAALLPTATVRVTTRVANPRRLWDQISAGAPLPDAPWLSGTCRDGLRTLSGRWAKGWVVGVRDHSVTIDVPGAGCDRYWLPFLFDLACDLAESVDGTTTIAAAWPD